MEQGKRRREAAFAKIEQERHNQEVWLEQERRQKIEEEQKKRARLLAEEELLDAEIQKTKRDTPETWEELSTVADQLQEHAQLQQEQTREWQKGKQQREQEEQQWQKRRWKTTDELLAARSQPGSTTNTSGTGDWSRLRFTTVRRSRSMEVLISFILC